MSPCSRDRNDTSVLPYFVYGPLKPDQPGHGRVHADIGHVESATLDDYGLRVRDGLPGLVALDGGQTSGALLFPRPGREHALRTTVTAFALGGIYTARDVHVRADGRRQRAITCVFANGTDGYPNEGDEGWWSIALDPLLARGLPLLVEQIADAAHAFAEDPEQRGEAGDSEMGKFWGGYLPLLGQYLIVWSALERYLTLAFAERTVPAALRKLAATQEGKDAVDGVWAPAVQEVFNSQTLVPIAWSEARAWDFWYQVRCNAVHRGKSADRDAALVASSAHGLSTALTKLLLPYIPSLAARR